MVKVSHSFLIDGFYLLVNNNKVNAKLVIVGGGPIKDHLINKVDELGLTKHVCFTGYRHDALKIMANLDIVVFPSKNEPFGRVIIEAMSVGTPVIATEGGGIPEIIMDGFNGVIVQYGDVHKLGNAVINFINDESFRKKIAFNARCYVKEKFSQENYNKSMKDIFHKQLNM